MKSVFTIFALFIGCAVAQDQHEFVPVKVNHSIPMQSLEQSLIVKGRRARTKQFPYQVGLMLDSGASSGFTWCGGILISDQWILTAAHCTEGVVVAYAHLGAYDRTNFKEAGQKIITIKKNNFIVHEQWDDNIALNDIALIKLPSPIELNDQISPAKLPKMNGNYSEYVGAKVIASGWGRVKDSEKAVTNKLRWIEVPVMSNAECAPYYNRPKVVKTHICIAAKGGRSACKGDSGGPLVLADGSLTVIGITAFGLDKSCEKSFPSVYTRVTPYLDWIAEHSGVVNK